MASCSATGVLTEAAPADLSATAWREGKLIFRATPLSTVFAELGRCHPAAVHIADPTLARLPLSGIFKVDDLPLFLATVVAFRIRHRLLLE